MTDDNRRHRGRGVDRLLKSMFAHLQGRPTPERLLSVLEQDDDLPDAHRADTSTPAKKTGGASGA